MHGRTDQRTLPKIDSRIRKGLHILLAVDKLPFVLGFVLTPHLQNFFYHCVREEGFTLRGSGLGAFKKATKECKLFSFEV